jgi:outer membrane protein OmpA-like peptidoglycan-associated protein
MRYLFSLLCVLLVLVKPGLAQVTVNLGALSALPAPTRAAPPHRAPHARSRPAPRPVVALPVPPIPPMRAPPPEVATITPPATLPKVPAAPPAVATMAPLSPPLPSAAPPPAPPISPQAPSKAAPTTTGLTVTFGEGDATLSPASASAIRHLVALTPKTGETSYNVLAYAAGNTKDPSTARRLSLERGLTVRGVLLTAGVPSSRIYVRALGFRPDAGAMNRADITIMGTNAPHATPARPVAQQDGGPPP